ncbi:MAG: endonuclease III, partial [Clostridia bacterium]|nr:endonuclease III [Deltaproteobacteria bacterium]
AEADPIDVEEIIRTTGFYRNKAKSIIGMAKALVEEHDGEVPRTLEQLIEIPGAARKTANVVLGTAFRIASGVVVDTHVQRLSQLIGLTDHDDVKHIEKDLMNVVPQSDWIDFSHMLILHGRRICVARRPLCEACVINTLCRSAFEPAVGYVPKDAIADKTTKKKKIVVETKATRAARALLRKARNVRPSTKRD